MIIRMIGVALALAASAGILAFQRTQLPQLVSLAIVPFYALRLAAVVLYVVAIGQITARLVAANVPIAIRRASVLIFGVLLCPALLEASLMFVPRSHGNGSSLAAAVWYRYYWGHVNPSDYRDRDIDPSAEAHLTKMLAIGDSFTAGAGIKNPDDRFSGRLQAALGAGTRVYNAGIPGADTIDEFKRLVTFPVTPDVVILQYFGNDIERRASLYDPKETPEDWRIMTAGSREPPAPSPGTVTRIANDALTRLAGSSLITSCLNTLFSCNYLSFLAPSPPNPYIDQLFGLYASPSVWRAHEQDLRQFIVYSKTHGTRLIVVVFPFLQQPEASRYYTQKVSAVFRREGIPAVDLTDDVLRLSLAERVVNSNDPHASPRVHQIAAERLLQVLRH